MTADARKKALVFLFPSLVITAAIGAGLSDLAFKPGMPLPFFGNGQVILPSADGSAVGMSVSSFAEIVLMCVFGACVLVIMIQAARGAGWKRIVRGFFSLLWKLLLAAVLLCAVVAFLQLSPEMQGESASIPTPQPLKTAPLEPVPAILIWIVGAAVVAAVVFLTVGMIAARGRRDSGLLGEEAQKAREALLAGEDLRAVILQCYRRMGLALKREREIERDAFMTTGEFEELLIEKGMPSDPVHRLTRLFDAVRYGRRRPEPADEREALSCLEAIIEASGRTGREKAE